MTLQNKMLMLSFLVLTAGSGSSFAGVSTEQAAKLGAELTPYGAIRAGNEEGSIPEWTGGMTSPPSNYEGDGTTRIDPFSDEEPLFIIDSSNYKDYSENLSTGQKALFEQYPDSFYMPIYKTHRTAAAPDWVYENISKNATSAELTPDGNGIKSASGGIPFPIPENGLEVIWNHNLRWIGQATFKDFVAKTVYPNGSIAMSGVNQWEKYTYYDKDEYNPDYNGTLLEMIVEYTGPVRRKGELIALLDSINQSETPRQAWQYIPGQRRVRRAPTISFDTPSPTANGQITYDDTYIFNGSPERYDWTLLGKKEIYIPYNNNRWVAKVEQGEKAHSDILKKNHLNPEYERYELHRVWVIEANLKDDKRHVYGKRVFYIDEDTWNIALADNFDGKGNLWRTVQAHMLNAYDVPATVIRGYVSYDFQNGAYYVAEMDSEPMRFYEGEVDSFYSPAQLRKMSRR